MFIIASFFKNNTVSGVIFSIEKLQNFAGLTGLLKALPRVIKGRYLGDIFLLTDSRNDRLKNPELGLDLELLGGAALVRAEAIRSNPFRSDVGVGKSIFGVVGIESTTSSMLNGDAFVDVVRDERHFEAGMSFFIFFLGSAALWLSDSSAGPKNDATT